MRAETAGYYTESELRARGREHVPFDVLHGPMPEPTHAGLAVVAADTGRTLMLQRAVTDGDPAGGMWEWPGGGIEDGETPFDAACREWREETGLDLPKGEVVGEWKAGGGIYCGYVYEVPREDALDVLAGRDLDSDPDQDGDSVEALAWWDCEHLSADNPALRQELRDSLTEVAKALPKSRRVRAAEAAVAIVDVLTGGEYTLRQRVARAEFLRAARRPRVPQPPLGPPVIPPPPRGKRWRDYAGRYTWSPGASQAEIDELRARFARRPSAFMPKQKSAAPAKKATATAPDLTGARGLSTVPAVREVQIDNRVREAVAALEGERTPGFGGRWVPLAFLRDHPLLRDLPRADVDEALRRFAVTPGSQVIPWDNRKALTAADRAAAVRIGGDPSHVIRIDDTTLLPLPAAPAKKATAAKAVGRTLTQDDALRLFAEGGLDVTTPAPFGRDHWLIGWVTDGRRSGQTAREVADSAEAWLNTSAALDMMRHNGLTTTDRQRWLGFIARLREFDAKAPAKKATPRATTPPKRTPGPSYHVGFTGTRGGMDATQRERFRARMAEIKAEHPDATFHYGQAVGADDEAAQIARELGFRVVSHPSNLAKQTAPSRADESRSPKPPLDRNRDIVAESDVVLATPRTEAEELRSGTWATIRQARRTNVPLELLAPPTPTAAKRAPAKAQSAPADPGVEAAREAARAAARKLNEREAAERAQAEAEEDRLISLWTGDEGGELTDVERVGLRLLAAQVLSGSISRAEAARRTKSTSVERFAEAIRKTPPRPRPGRARRGQVWIVGNLEEPNAVRLVQREDVPEGVPTYATKKEAQGQVWRETLADMEQQGWIHQTEAGIEVTERGVAENERLAAEFAAERKAKKQATRGKRLAFDLKPGDRIMVQFDSEGNLLPELDRYDSFPVTVVRPAVPPDYAVGVVDDEGRELTTIAWNGDPVFLRRQVPRFRLETAAEARRGRPARSSSPPFGAAAASAVDAPAAAPAAGRRPQGRPVVTAGTPIDPAFEGLRSTGDVEQVAAREARRITGRDITFDYGDADPAVAAEWSSGLLRGLERFPAARLETVRAGRIGPREDVDEEGDLFALTEMDGRLITFDTHGLGPVEYRRWLEMNGGGHLAVGSPFGLALHEFGHVVAFSYPGSLFSVPSMHDEADGWAQAYAASAGSSLRRVAVDQISRRAVAKRGELLPEAFAQVMAGRPSELAQGIVARMDEYAARAPRTGRAVGVPGAAAGVADPLGLAGRSDAYSGSAKIDGQDGSLIAALYPETDGEGPTAALSTVKRDAVAGWDFTDEDNSHAYIDQAHAAEWADAVDSALSGRQGEAEADGVDVGDLYVRSTGGGMFEVGVWAYPLRPDQEEAEYRAMRAEERAELARTQIPWDPDEDEGVTPEEFAAADAAELARFDRETEEVLAEFRDRRFAYTVTFTRAQAETLRDWLRDFATRPAPGAAAGMRDPLKLADRIELDPGEVFTGSDKLDSDRGGRVRLAATLVDGRPMVRLGIGTDSFGGRDDPAGPWRGGPVDVSAENAERARRAEEYRRLQDLSDDEWTPELEARFRELDDDADFEPIRPDGYTARLGAAQVEQLRSQVLLALAKARTFDDDILARWAEIERLDAEIRRLSDAPAPDGSGRLDELVAKYIAFNGHRTPDGDWFTPPTPGAPPLTPEEDAELDRLHALVDAHYDQLHDLRRRRFEANEQFQAEARELYDRSLTEGVVAGEWADLHWRVYTDEEITLEVWNVPHGTADAPTDSNGDDVEARFDAAGAEKLLRTLARAVGANDSPGAAVAVIPPGFAAFTDEYGISRPLDVADIGDGVLVSTHSGSTGVVVSRPGPDGTRVIFDDMAPDRARAVGERIQEAVDEANGYDPDEEVDAWAVGDGQVGLHRDGSIRFVEAASDVYVPLSRDDARLLAEAIRELHADASFEDDEDSNDVYDEREPRPGLTVEHFTDDRYVVTIDGIPLETEPYTAEEFITGLDGVLDLPEQSKTTPGGVRVVDFTVVPAGPGESQWVIGWTADNQIHVATGHSDGTWDAMDVDSAWTGGRAEKFADALQEQADLAEERGSNEDDEYDTEQHHLSLRDDDHIYFDDTMALAEPLAERLAALLRQWDQRGPWTDSEAPVETVRLHDFYRLNATLHADGSVTLGDDPSEWEEYIPPEAVEDTADGIDYLLATLRRLQGAPS